MLARVAEHIYWLGRYLERVDGTVRLLNTNTNLMMDSPYTTAMAGWSPLIAVTGSDKQFNELYPIVSAANVSQFIISDKRNSGSLLSSIHSVRYNLRACRDMMPNSLYNNINRLCLTAKNAFDEPFNITATQNLLSTIEEQLLTISGAISTTMNRGQGYQFMRIGMYLERADMTSRVLDVRSANLLPAKGEKSLAPFENRQWESVLRSVSALQNYRHNSGPVAGPTVLSYLLQNRDNPRSYCFCIQRLKEGLEALGGGDKALEAIDELRKNLDAANLDELADDPSLLHAFVDQLEILLAAVSDGISSSYYSPEEA